MANRYWVGGSANWDATAGTKWSTTSGGAGGAAVPTSSDDVFFNAASGAVTVTRSPSTLSCASLNFTGFTGTFAGSADLTINGDITLASGMTSTFSGTVTWIGTSGDTRTITSNGKRLTSFTLTMNSTGVTYRLLDQFETYGNITLSAGTFDANSQTVLLSGVGTYHTLIGVFTFYNLIIGGTSGATVSFRNNTTIANLFTINNPSFTDIRGYGAGGAKTSIISANNSFTNRVIISNIDASGAASWNLSAVSGGSGDAGNNSGITFTSPVTRYWVGNSGTWDLSSTSKWSATSGGASGASAPLPQDNVVFDSNSITSGGWTVSMSSARCQNLTMTGVANSPIFSGSVYVYGDFIGGTATWSAVLYFQGYSKTQSFNQNGLTAGSSSNIYLNNHGTAVSLASDCVVSATFSIGNGVTNNTLTTNNYNLTCGYLLVLNAATLNLGSSTVTLTGATGGSYLAQIGDYPVINAGTSTFILQNTSSGTIAKAFLISGNQSFYNVTVTGDRITWDGASTVTNTLAINLPGTTYGFYIGYGTKTVNNITSTASAGNLVKLRSSATGVQRAINDTSGVNNISYFDIQDIRVGGGATWNAINSVDSGNNLGWIGFPPIAPQQWSHGFNIGSLTPFVMGGDADWTIVPTGTGSTSSAKSGTIGNNQYSVMALTYVTTNAVSAVGYIFKVSSEFDYNFLRVFVDGVEKRGYSGEDGFYDEIIISGTGEHTVEFSYEKDPLVIGGSDAAWIDSVVILADDPVEIVFEAPSTGEFTEPIVTPPLPVVRHRQLFFKIEKLDSDENIIEELSVDILGGNVEVGTGGARRKCTFEIADALPADWQAHKFKLYYGYRNRSTDAITYYPEGVFIPIYPAEKEVLDGKITNFQGVDKKKLFADYAIENPVIFTSGTTVRSIIQTVAGWVNETKLILDATLGTLGVDFTFEEGSTAEQMLDALISSFEDEWFYNADGFLVARKRVAAISRPIRFVIDDDTDPMYISASRSVKDDNYYNKVTLVGGMVDTPIYRATVEDTAAIAAAGGRVVSRYFKRDAAVTQTQVDGLAAYYLSNGVLLPSTLSLTSLVIPDLERDDIIQKGGVRYEVRSFNVPLGLGTQSIEAGEIV